MNRISATIITLNEEKNIAGCLDSLSFADEIIVVDSGSSDRTESICRQYPRVRFFMYEWQGFGRQKNIAAGFASNDWILNIDADERVSDELKNSILAAEYTMFSGFRMARANWFGSRWIKTCGWYPDYNARLYNRQSCRFSERLVHETLESSGSFGVLDGNLIHFTYSGISDYLNRMDRYSTLAAEELNGSGKRRSAWFRMLFSPLATFVKMYILRNGFLDGWHGFVLSVLYSFYTFCKYAKLSEKQMAEFSWPESRKQ